MAVSAFGVAHLEPIGKALSEKDKTVGLGAGAAGAGVGAVAAHGAGRDLKRSILPRRGLGVLRGAIKGDPDQVERHIRGAKRDVRNLVALKHGRNALAAGAAGLGGLAVLEGITHRTGKPAAPGPAPEQLSPSQAAARLRAVQGGRSG